MQMLISDSQKTPVSNLIVVLFPGIILCMHPANQRRCYEVTSSLIGGMHTQNDPCVVVSIFEKTGCIINRVALYNGDMTMHFVSLSIWAQTMPETGRLLRQSILQESMNRSPWLHPYLINCNIKCWITPDAKFNKDTVFSCDQAA